VELQNFQQRKRALEYDDVLNQQRDVIYSTRLFALEKGEETKAEALKMIRTAATRIAEQWVVPADGEEQLDRLGLREALTLQFLIAPEALNDPAATPDDASVVAAVVEEAEAAFERKIAYLRDFGDKINIPDVDRQVLSQVMLQVLDEKWKDHLHDLDQLRNAIHYRAYGQKDPLVEYKKEAFEMFEDLLRDIQGTFAERFLKVQVNVQGPPPPPPPPPPVATPSADPTDDLFSPRPPSIARGGGAPAPSGTAGSRVQATDTRGRAVLPGANAPDPNAPAIGRNDPCPCGSGKKYKKCHGANA
jgi:preprotein translocase subunit SecA